MLPMNGDGECRLRLTGHGRNSNAGFHWDLRGYQNDPAGVARKKDGVPVPDVAVEREQRIRGNKYVRMGEGVKVKKVERQSRSRPPLHLKNKKGTIQRTSG